MRNKLSLYTAACCLWAACVWTTQASTRLDWCVGGGFLDAGIDGAYYDNENLSGEPAFTRHDVRIDFDWSWQLKPGGSISERYQRLGNNNYSVRWVGRFMPRFNETYTFKLIHDDGARLMIKPASSDSWLWKINQWSESGTHTANHNLTAGEVYDIKVEYREVTGSAKCRLLWSSPSTPEEVIQAATCMGMKSPDKSMQFANAFFGGSNWGEYYPSSSTDPKHDETLERDAQGWPNEDFTFSIRPNDDRIVPGTYLLQFQGRADVRLHLVDGEEFFSFDGSVSYGNQLEASSGGEGYDAANNITRARIVIPRGENGFWPQFTKTDRDGNFGGDGNADNDGVTDVWLQKPSAPFSDTPHEIGEVFDRGMKEAWRRFTVTRWNDSNGAKLDDPDDGVDKPCFPNWNERSRFLKSTYGVNHEEKILWCNENGCDLWIQVYHHVIGDDAANNNYVRKLARLIRYGADADGNPYTDYQTDPVFPGLNPNLKVYVEYSNEAPWNSAGQYPQAGWILQRADWEVANNTAKGNIITFDGPATENQQRGRRYMAIRIREISDLFREVYGNAHMPGTADDPTVRPVFMGQYDNANIPRDVLYFMDRYYNNADGINHVSTPRPVDYYLWSYGAAAYYGCTNPYGEMDDFTWTNADAENPALNDGQAVVAPTDFPHWTFTGKAGVYRNAARSTLNTGGNYTYTVGSSDKAVYEFFGEGDEVVAVYDVASGEKVMNRPLEDGYRQAGAFIFFTQEDKYYPLIMQAGRQYRFEGGSSVKIANNGIRSGYGADDINLHFNYDASSGSQAIFLAGESSATLDLNLPAGWNTYAVRYDLAQIRDHFDADGDGVDYTDELKNPLDIFLVLEDGTEQRITARDRSDIDPANGPSAHGDFGRHTDSFQTWGSAPFSRNDGNVKIRFVGTKTDDRYVVLLDNIHLTSANDMAAGEMPVSGSATAENPSGDWIETKRHQWVYAQAYGLHPGMYEGGWYPGGDWDRTPLQLYFSMKHWKAKSVEKQVQNLYANIGIHFQCDYTFGLSIPDHDLNNSENYQRFQAWDELQSALPADEDNGEPMGEITPASSPWFHDADPATGVINAHGGFFSWNVVIPEFGDYYIQVATDMPADYRVYLDGSEVVFDSDGASTVQSGMAADLTKGLHNIRIQSTDDASFEVITWNIQRLSSQPSTVDAGPDQSVTLPEDTMTLAGSVTDPDSSPSVSWSVFEKPEGGVVHFANAGQLNTSVTFDRPGDYVLQLTADDSGLEISDYMTATVEPGGANQLLNSDFSRADQFVNVVSWVNNGNHADIGWCVVENESNWLRDSGSQYVYVEPVSWGRSMAQIVTDDHVTKGWQELRFRARQQGSGNRLEVYVYGVNGDFQMPLAGDDGPQAVDGSGAVGTLLANQDVGAINYDWKTWKLPVNAGNGYDYLVVKFYTYGVSATEEQMVDDVTLSGGEIGGGGGNLALNQPAKWGTYGNTWSNPSGTAPTIVDGDAATGQGTHTGSDKTWQWYAVDLGSSLNINRVDLQWKDSNHRAVDYQIQTSDDAVNWSTRKTVTGNGDIETSDSFGAVNAQYIRIKVNLGGFGEGGLRTRVILNELEVYGGEDSGGSGVDPVVDGVFNTAAFTLGGGWIQCANHADAGWVVNGNNKAKWNLDTSGHFAWADNTDAPNMAQIITDNGRTTGTREFAFDAINAQSGNTLDVYIYGVQDDTWGICLYDDRGPRRTDGVPVNYTELLHGVCGGANTYADWTTLYRDVNFGTGYKYIAIVFKTRGVNDGETQRIDNVTLAGSGGDVPMETTLMESADAEEPLRLPIPRAQDDPDGDGMNNYEESMANTDPNDAEDVMLVRDVRPVADGSGMVIRWNSEPDRVYGVSWMPDLVSGQSETLASGLPATPPVNVYTDTVHGVEAQGYYRVNVSME